MKEIIVFSHCILNSASKVETDERLLEDEYIIRNKLLNKVIEKNIQIVQLPCPEFMAYGSMRWGHTKDQFDNPFFKNYCHELIKPIIFQLKEYKMHENKFSIKGIVSVEGSPSCGSKLTCRGDWGGEFCGDIHGEIRIPKIKMQNEPGVFMEVLKEELCKANLNEIPIITMEEAYKII